ncbi:MAG: hypothetical protein WCL28_05035 [bacterium]
MPSQRKWEFLIGGFARKFFWRSSALVGFTMTSAGDALIKKSLTLLQAASGLSAAAG